MSSDQDGNQKKETLLLFELLVEYIQIDGEKKISDTLAVGIRLLDFPTLLVYQPKFGGDNNIQCRQQDNNTRWIYSFNRGKSCFFEMNLDSLYTQLISTPLYVMILDVKDEIPKLLGTSLISMATVVNRIKQDSIKHDVAGCSSYGERGLVRVCNLAEKPVGVISLSYKLLIVGLGLPSHVTQKIPVHREQCAQEDIETSDPSQKLNLGCTRLQFPSQDGDVGRNIVDKQAESTQTEHDTIRQIHHTFKERNGFEEDLAVFCPPQLYYCNSGKEKHKTQGSEYRLSQPDSSAVAYEESFSENEHSSITDQALEIAPKKTASVSTDVVEEALRPLPLLNALFVELSQLNVHNLHRQTVSNRPDLVSVCKHSSTEFLDGQRSLPKTSKSSPEQERRRGYGPYLKHLDYPTNISPRNPKTDPEGPLQNNQALMESKPHRTKLVYGTTKSYNLRRQKNNTVAKSRDCMVSHTAEETTSTAFKGKKRTKQNSWIPKENTKKTENMDVSKENAKKTENMDVSKGNTKKTENMDVSEQNTNMTQHMEVFSVLEDSTKHEVRSELQSPKQDEALLVSIPRINDEDNAASSMLPKMSVTWTKSESHNVKLDSSRNSRDGSPLFSSPGSEKEEDYADDFNSFEAVDTDGTSSPEPAQEAAQFLRRFLASDLDSEPVKERPFLPSPIRGGSPVQRILRGTQPMRPQREDAALSFSSNEDQEEGSASLEMKCSKKKEENSAATSSRGQKSESSSLDLEGSLKSVSSDPLEAEELKDDLGSLDFRKEYQDISELVGFKLPGYTM
ncbi:uncharacterized protein map10 [Stigmatopora argus]